MIYFFFVTIVTLGAEFLRRLMPPPRLNRRKDDPDDREYDEQHKYDKEYDGEEPH